MNVNTILADFKISKNIPAETIALIHIDDTLRKKLINHFRIQQDREFALSLINNCIAIRKQSGEEMPAETLMLACYILGLHNQIEDCLKIWEAKEIDFDTHCGLDIQLLPFAGVDQTITFLKEQTGAEAQEAFKYTTRCAGCGDFDNQEAYFSTKTIPWFI